MRILCLDVGSKRIGTAISDDLGIAAHPLTVLERRGLDKDLSDIVDICRRENAGLVVIGIPLDEEGGHGPQAKKIVGFADALRLFFEREGVSIPIEMWDERYSTAEAEDMLIEADVSRAKRRRVIDRVAAARILEDYMAHRDARSKDQNPKSKGQL